MDIRTRIKGMKKRTIILIVVLAFVVFATFSLVLLHYLKGRMAEEMQTETCQIALEHLMNTAEIRQRYGLDVQPELRGIEKHINTSGVTDRIQYTFRFPEGGQYKIVMHYENDEWVIVQVIKIT